MSEPPAYPTRLFFCLLCLTPFSGCAKPPSRTVSVSGRITLNGRPVERARVLFLSPHQDDRPAFGVTDADGHYELRTYFSQNDIPPGAVPGKYMVIVEKRLLPDIGRAMRRVGALGPGHKRQRYLEDQAMKDVWPDGVPDGWPNGFVPSVMPMPKHLLENKEARNAYNRLLQGVHLLPERYSQTDSTPFQVVIDRSREQWSFDFDLRMEQ